MKPLQNPLVVAAMAAVALALVALNFIAPLWRTARPFRNQPDAGASAEAHQAGPADAEAQEPQDTAQQAAANPIDTGYALGHLTEWIESPPRDPFALYPKRTRDSDKNAVTAAEVLRLNAVWRQTGSQLAVINGQIVAEGQTIQGFEVERVEAESVWVRGAQGRECIEFRPLDSRGATNQAQAPKGSPSS